MSFLPQGSLVRITSYGPFRGLMGRFEAYRMLEEAEEGSGEEFSAPVPETAQNHSATPELCCV